MDNLLPWLLGKRGQLRVAGVEHYLANQYFTPSQYTIMDEVFYSIVIETKNETGDWIPFEANDVQLEFVRIDPFIRRNLDYKGRNEILLALFRYVLVLLSGVQCFFGRAILIFLACKQNYFVFTFRKLANIITLSFFFQQATYCTTESIRPAKQVS